MQSSNFSIIKALFLIWAMLCILLFINSPGKVTYVQWGNLAEWQDLAGKLARWNLASDLMNLFLASVGVVVFSGACTSLGIFVAKKIKIDNAVNSVTSFTGLALLATEFLIGHAILSLIFLTLGGLYQLTPIHVITVLSTGFLLGFRYIGSNFISAFTYMKSKPKETLSRKRDKTIVWLLISILFFSLWYSTARISYDASAIYYSNAKLSAMVQQIQFFVDDTFVVSAFQTAIQYTALIQVFGDQSARLFSWICGLVIIIFSVALGERIGMSQQARLILLALLLTSTALLDLMGDGKVDLISSAPAIAAVYWMVVEGQNNTLNRSQLLLIGVLIGLAIVSRPFNAFLLGIYVVLFYLQRLYLKLGFEPINYGRFMKTMLWIGMGVFVLGIYHLVLNWIILGNPLAFLSSISKIDPSNGPWDYSADQILVVRLLYPFVATFYNSPQTLGNISPLFLAFLPALFMPQIRKKTVFSKQMLILSAISIITLLLWIFIFFTVLELRYVLFVWAILFMPVAEIIATVLESDDYPFRSILGASIITLLVFTILRTLYISLDTYSPIDKNGAPQCYDSRFCQFLRPINQLASPGDRVLTLNAFRYYLRPDLFACSTQHDEYNRLRAAAKAGNESFWLEVYKEGYKYIAYENDYTTRHLQMGIIPSSDNTPEWLELMPIYGAPGDLAIAYVIKVKDPPSNINEVCQINTKGIWEVKFSK